MAQAIHYPGKTSNTLWYTVARFGNAMPQHKKWLTVNIGLLIYYDTHFDQNTLHGQNRVFNKGCLYCNTK